MNISVIAKALGMNAKAIRHYESLGIIPKAERSEAGYRVYSEKDLHILRFVKHARGLGFSLPEIKKLLGLWKNKSRQSAEVKSISARHIAALEAKIRELEAMKAALEQLAKNCHGDQRPDCPILDGLGTAVPAEENSSKLQRPRA